LAGGFQILARNSNGFSLFLRYQAQSDRLYRRAVEELERLWALRPNLSTEPIMDPDPPETTPLPPPETNPPAPQTDPSTHATAGISSSPLSCPRSGGTRPRRNTIG
jgi:hypothetical protein